MSQVHKILEAILEQSPYFELPGEFKNRHDIIRQEVDWLLRSAKFKFEFYPEDPEVRRFGVEAFNKGVLKRPFDISYYEYEDVQAGVNGRFGVLLYGAAPRFDLGMSVYMAPKGQSWGRVGQVGLDLNTEDHGLMSITRVATISPGIMQRELADECLAACATDALALTAMLSSKSVKTEHEPEPVKLNARRDARGRPPIGAYSRISLDLPKIRGVRGEASGDRASPVMHWRRGHIRHWGDRMIPIAPTIVNAGDDAPLKKEYRVRGRTGGE